MKEEKEYTYKEQQDTYNNEKSQEMLAQMPDYISKFYKSRSNNKYSSRTLLEYLRDIDTFFFFLEESYGVSRAQITLEYLERLPVVAFDEYWDFLGEYSKNSKTRKNETKARSRKMIAVRQLYKFLMSREMISRNPSVGHDLQKDKEEKSAKEISALSVDQVREFMASVSEGKGLSKNKQTYNKDNELRDTAIMEVFLNTGMRVSELVGLNLDDISLEEDCLYIVRKGHKKPDKLFFNKKVHNALSHYLEAGRKESEKDPEALFISRRGSRITVRSVERLVEKYAKASGVNAFTKVTAHTLRRTYGTALYEQTDLFTVANRLGHKSIETTRKHYVRPSDELDKKSGNMDLF